MKVNRESNIAFRVAALIFEHGIQRLPHRISRRPGRWKAFHYKAVYFLQQTLRDRRLGALVLFVPGFVMPPKLFT